jgi:hypothetical protein
MKPLSALLLAAASSQAVTYTYTQTADNNAWPSAPSPYNDQSYQNLFNGPNAYGFYDAFKINAQGDANASIASITLSFRFDGLFDDSVGIDLNGNGTIDYAIGYYAIAAKRSGWAPWSDLTDAANLGMVLNITASGTTATTYIYGVAVTNSGSGYVNTLSNITLASLGLATLDASGAATSTKSLRIGFLNIDGGGGGAPNISQGSFNYNPSTTYSPGSPDPFTPPPSVPEPSTYGLALGGLALVAVALKRRNKSSK